METITSESVEPQSIVMVSGQPLTQLPEDLFIPPDALEVLLDSFSGPLDLLLYLIKKQNIDILDIPILQITKQYLQYIQAMEFRRIPLAAEYLLMAAMLAEIKSRLLLPVHKESEEEDEIDPRMELVRRLQAYEQIKQAAETLETLPRVDRDHFTVCLAHSENIHEEAYEQITVAELLASMQNLLVRDEQLSHHEIHQELLSVDERMEMILIQLKTHSILNFNELYQRQEGRLGIVVSLLAILELARKSLLIIQQNDNFSPIYLRAKTND